MKENLINSRQFFINSVNSNKDTSSNYGGMCASNINDITFKKNCESIEKYLKKKPDHINFEDNIDDTFKIKKSCGKVSDLATTVKAFGLSPFRYDRIKLNPSENFIVNNNKSPINNNFQNKAIQSNLIKKSDKKEKTPNKLKNNAFIPDIKKENGINKTLQTDFDAGASKSKAVFSEIINSETKKDKFYEISQRNTQYYLKKIKRFKDLFYEIKDNPFLTNRKELQEEISLTIKEIKYNEDDNYFLIENTLQDENKYILKTIICDINKKIDCLMKENAILKEMIQSKSDDNDHLKDLMINLTNMFVKFTTNGGDKNLKENNPKIQNKSSEKNKKEKKRRSFDSCQSGTYVKNKERTPNKLYNLENNSNYSICSEFSIDYSKDNLIYTSNKSLMTNRIIHEEEKTISSDIIENTAELPISSENNENPVINEKLNKDFCYVSQLEITSKNLFNHQDSNSQIINFDNNSFKQDIMGSLLTVKHQNTTQSNGNSISTKTTKVNNNETNGKLYK